MAEVIEFVPSFGGIGRTVRVAIEISTGHLLTLKDSFELPSFKLDPLDNPREIAIRKMKEEFGMEITIRERIATYRIVGDKGELRGSSILFLAFCDPSVKFPSSLCEQSILISDATANKPFFTDIARFLKSGELPGGGELCEAVLQNPLQVA